LLKKIFKIVFINLLILAVFFGFMELLFRTFFPEFQGQVTADDQSYGKHMAYSRYRSVRMRIPYKDCPVVIKDDTPAVLVMGDSISYGYGCAYEDIYWRKFKRIMDATSGGDLQIINLPGYGDNLEDSAEKLVKFLTKFQKKPNIKVIVYQFNFNDIMPFKGRDLKAKAHLSGMEKTALFAEVARWRHKYLNQSVFLRVVQHYAGRLQRKTSGSCAARGLDALGPYTWTYGAKPFRQESEKAWAQFTGALERLKKLADKLGAHCVMMISPILYDIDTRGAHPSYNWQHFDFSCATIDPRKRLNDLARRLDVDVIDPKDYVRRGFEERLREGNFEPFFFATDENHITPVTAQYIAEYMVKYFQSKKYF
jgi:hypothetical protein